MRLGFFGRLFNETEWWRREGGDIPAYSTATLLIEDETGKPVSGVVVEISNAETGYSYTTITDSKGIAIVVGEMGTAYTLIISGSGIETKTIDGWNFGDSDIDVEVKPYLTLRPTYIWLMPSNQNRADVDVLSNVDWEIS